MNNGNQNQELQLDKFTQAKHLFLGAIAKKIYSRNDSIESYEREKKFPEIPQEDKKILIEKLAEMHYQGYIEAKAEEANKEKNPTDQDYFSRPNLTHMLHNLLSMYTIVNDDESSVKIAKEIMLEKEFIYEDNLEGFCKAIINSGEEGKVSLVNYLSFQVDRVLHGNYSSHLLTNLPKKLDELCGDDYTKHNFIDKYLIALSTKNPDETKNIRLGIIYDLAKDIGYTSEKNFWKKFVEATINKKDIVSLENAFIDYRDVKVQDSIKEWVPDYSDRLVRLRRVFIGTGDYKNAEATAMLQKGEKASTDEISFSPEEYETLGNAMIEKFRNLPKFNGMVVGFFTYTAYDTYKAAEYLKMANTKTAWLALGNLYVEAMDNSKNNDLKAHAIEAYLKADKPEQALGEIKRHDDSGWISRGLKISKQYLENYPQFHAVCLEYRAMKYEELIAKGKEKEAMDMFEEDEPERKQYNEKKNSLEITINMEALGKGMGLSGDNWPLIVGYIKANGLMKWIKSNYPISYLK